MLEYYREHWYWAVVLLALCALTLFALSKAMKISARNRADREKFLAESKYENMVRAEFRALDARSAEQAEPKRLLDGAALSLQAALEDKADMSAAFLELPEPQQLIYALYFFFEDATDGLSVFFRRNGKPLTPAALRAARLFFGAEAVSLVEQTYAAYNEENETASLLPEEVARWDEEFAALAVPQAALPQIAAYIRENWEVFQ